MEGVTYNPWGADRKLSSPGEVPPYPGTQSGPTKLVPPPLLCRPRPFLGPTPTSI